MYGLILFIVGTLGALYLTRVSARAGFRHGLARFFAFEALLGLAAVNLKYWFDDPLSLRQLISWGLLLLSALLGAYGFRLLRRIGKAEEEFDQTTVLVTSGAYRYIRHPLYASLLYFGLGAFLKQVSLLTFGLLMGAFIFQVITARVEEERTWNASGRNTADTWGRRRCSSRISINKGVKNSIQLAEC